MDTKTIIHIGCELVVIGGVIYWAKKNNTEVNGRCDELYEYTSRLEKILIAQSDKIARLEMVVSSLMNRDINSINIPTSQTSQAPPSPAQPQPLPQVQQPPLSAEQLQEISPLAHRKQKKPVTPPPPPQQNDYESDYLDEMLRKENSSEDSEAIEVEVFEQT